MMSGLMLVMMSVGCIITGGTLSRPGLFWDEAKELEKYKENNKKKIRKRHHIFLIISKVEYHWKACLIVSYIMQNEMCIFQK